MKPYTDIEQSKKLAEILPLESADMYWKNGISEKYIQCFTPFVIDDCMLDVDFDYDVLCWSLAALLGVLPILDNRSPVTSKTFDGKYRVTYHSTTYESVIVTSDYDNPVDACYEMILKLHELNLL